MISDLIARQGGWLFRWRSYILLGFIPITMIVLRQGEPVEQHFGPAADSLYESACVILAFFGFAIRCVTVGFAPAGTSGRNTKSQEAAVLNTTGPYSLTRNPLYLGNAVIYMAIALFTESLLLTIVMGLFLTLYLERIIAAEERFLAARFGGGYLEWTRRVPVFFPRPSGWIPPALPFSVRNVLKREYSGFFAIIAAFAAIEFSGDWLTAADMRPDRIWLISAVAAGCLYVGLRYLKRRTGLLKVSGR